MDIADRAVHQEEMLRDLAMKVRQKVETHNGKCLNCRETSPTVFCDLDCKADYERIKNSEKRNGK
jgi:hypothetical protein